MLWSSQKIPHAWNHPRFKNTVWELFVELLCWIPRRETRKMVLGTFVACSRFWVSPFSLFGSTVGFEKDALGWMFSGMLLLDPLTWWVRTCLCLLVLARPFLYPFLSPGPGCWLHSLPGWSPGWVSDWATNGAYQIHARSKSGWVSKGWGSRKVGMNWEAFKPCSLFEKPSASGLKYS